MAYKGMATPSALLGEALQASSKAAQNAHDRSLPTFMASLTANPIVFGFELVLFLSLRKWLKFL